MTGDPYDTMLRACIDGLDEGDLREISVSLLHRIVRLCADTLTWFQDEEVPPLLYVKAWLLRVSEPVWRPEVERFATVDTITTDSVGLMRVAYGDDTVCWYSSDDVVQVAVHRGTAIGWNDRHPAQGATPTTDS